MEFDLNLSDLELDLGILDELEEIGISIFSGFYRTVVKYKGKRFCDRKCDDNDVYPFILVANRIKRKELLSGLRMAFKSYGKVKNMLYNVERDLVNKEIVDIDVSMINDRSLKLFVFRNGIIEIYMKLNGKDVLFYPAVEVVAVDRVIGYSFGLREAIRPIFVKIYNNAVSKEYPYRYLCVDLDSNRVVNDVKHDVLLSC